MGRRKFSPHFDIKGLGKFFRYFFLLGHLFFLADVHFIYLECISAKKNQRWPDKARALSEG
ncbi:hypothetical protein A3J15_03595 [Candidatus Roizmanbacteria bacterium RIFCSPLOWO2_02_FULL_38_10]|uniref:Uncharacterized protein n=1 Tax=Candidatus Roizmanbacteria bacterium RIFCSPLOWO2_02_FULL_38_10 TaxID=1802074 RepID=A0A1F7JKX4_9BACT|nr:MAG: hypothetical protein A3J15_03595 [Candidatus Roizmanbacteria bacterium RIFCSPLOWO2_02_FULL_38_10]